jgi:hypothetical protein
LWERIQGHCPAEHRPILDLRRQGHSLAEIAARTGLHPDSVRRILRTLARQLAFENQGSGDRSQGSGDRSQESAVVGRAGREKGQDAAGRKRPDPH